jgi:hypothetical protein
VDFLKWQTQGGNLVEVGGAEEPSELLSFAFVGRGQLLFLAKHGHDVILDSGGFATKNATICSCNLFGLLGIGFVHEVLTVSQLPSIKELNLVGDPGEPDSRLLNTGVTGEDVL